MEREFHNMTKDEIIDAIAEQLEFLPEEMRKPMVMNAFFTMLQ